MVATDAFSLICRKIRLFHSSLKRSLGGLQPSLYHTFCKASTDTNILIKITKQYSKPRTNSILTFLKATLGVDVDVDDASRRRSITKHRRSITKHHEASRSIRFFSVAFASCFASGDTCCSSSLITLSRLIRLKQIRWLFNRSAKIRS